MIKKNDLIKTTDVDAATEGDISDIGSTYGETWENVEELLTWLDEILEGTETISIVESGVSLTVDISKIFELEDLKDYYPYYDIDAEVEGLIVFTDESGTSVDEIILPDPTLGGVFPDLTETDMLTLLGL